MSKQGAYALRNRAGGGAFALAWDAAVEQLAHARVADEVRSRALHGCVEMIVRDGKVWGERHRFDNRLTMALLTRLDAKRDSRKDEDVDARIVAGEFDQFVAIAARGDLDAAAAFLADRHDAGWTNCEQARLLTRLGNYQRYGVGLPEEIHVADLDSTDPADWTEEQVERARRAEILEDEEDEEEEEAGGPNPSSIYRQLAGLADADGGRRGGRGRRGERGRGRRSRRRGRAGRCNRNRKLRQFHRAARGGRSRLPDGNRKLRQFHPAGPADHDRRRRPAWQGPDDLLASAAPYAIATAHCSRLYSQMCQALAASAAPRGTRRHAFGGVP